MIAVWFRIVLDGFGLFWLVLDGFGCFAILRVTMYHNSCSKSYDYHDFAPDTSKH